MGTRISLSDEDTAAVREITEVLLEATRGGDEAHDWSRYGCFSLSISTAGDGRLRVCSVNVGGRILSSLPATTVQGAVRGVRSQFRSEQTALPAAAATVAAPLDRTAAPR